MKSSVKAFCLATGQRVARSVAASLLAMLVGSATDLLSTPWTHDLAVAGMAGVVTLLLCIVGGATSGSGPAFGQTELTSPPADDPTDPEGFASPLTNPHRSTK